MGFLAFFLMLVGWLLIIFAAFGSGLVLNLGKLDAVDTGEVLVLLALCIGVAWPASIGAVMTRVRGPHQP